MNKLQKICLYTSVFLSAFLVFSIQPLIAQKLTPLLGGTPSVWNTLLMMFQGMLFLGYLYTGLFLKGIKPAAYKSYSLLLILSMALLIFPIQDIFAASPPDISHPNVWLLLNVSLFIGLPFILLSATAPFTQMLFSRNAQKTNSEPYWLYALGNIGSLLALISYPLLIQPLLDIETQFLLWKIAYVFFLITILCASFRPHLGGAMSSPQKNKFKNKDQEKSSIEQKLIWVLLAFCPSSLLHGVTTIITNDISSFPLLWIIPLSLYLITYILAFSGKLSGFKPQSISFLTILFLLPICILPLWLNPTENILVLCSHLAAFFVLSLFSHMCLYDKRPQVTNLGSFYICIAAGGFLGGLFNALIAPYIFDKIYEYPLTLIVSAFAIFWANKARATRTLNISGNEMVLTGIFAAITIFIAMKYPYDNIAQSNDITLLLCLSFVFVFFSFLRTNRTIFTTLCLTIALSFSGIALSSNIYLPDFRYIFSKAEQPYITRNFFGISKVVKRDLNEDITEYLYYNGFILHSAERYDKSKEKVIVNTGTYHTPIIENAANIGKPVASLGLGSGSDLCLAQGKNSIEFYEINQDVIDLAKNPQHLKSLSTCGNNYKIFKGDARLEIEKRPDEYYGGIISTATSSSTVPFHLMTKEAFSTYLNKLAPGGALSFLAPASYFDYTPLFEAYSHEFKMPVYEFDVFIGNKYKYQYFLFLKPPVNERALGESTRWKLLKPKNDKNILWRDGFYNIWSVIK